MTSFTVISVRKLKIHFHEDCDMDDAFLNSVISSRFWNISVEISLFPLLCSFMCKSYVKLRNTWKGMQQECLFLTFFFFFFYYISFPVRARISSV